MNVSLILQRSIGAAFRKMYGGFGVQSPNGTVQLRNALYCTTASTKAPIAVAWQPEVKRSPIPKAKPLRVLRYVEGGLPRTSVGRMVMSGSMADVCAELDRLAAQEMTLH